MTVSMVVVDWEVLGKIEWQRLSRLQQQGGIQHLQRGERRQEHEMEE